MQKAIRLLRLNKQSGSHNKCIGFLIFKEVIEENTLSRLRMYRCFRLKSNGVITDIIIQLIKLLQLPGVIQINRSTGKRWICQRGNQVVNRRKTERHWLRKRLNNDIRNTTQKTKASATNFSVRCIKKVMLYNITCFVCDEHLRSYYYGKCRIKYYRIKRNNNNDNKIMKKQQQTTTKIRSVPRS